MKCNMDCFNCIYDDCMMDVKSEYYYKNREKIIEQTKKWKRENPERNKENNRRHNQKYYAEHREERLAYFREYYRKKKLKKVIDG